jgi:hypothetical protein
MGFWSLTLRTGRKEHRCQACGRSIAPGEKSYDVAGIFEGDFTAYRECIPCHDLIERLSACGALDPGESFCFSDLAEIAAEAGETWPPVQPAIPAEVRG